MSRDLLVMSVALPHHPLPRPSLQTGRNGQQYYKDGPRYQAYKRGLGLAARNELPDHWELYEGAVSLHIVAEFADCQRPKCRVKETWHLKTPDNDNLIKPIQDALTKVVWFDDCSVPVVRFAKVWGAEDRVTLRVTTLDLDDGQRGEAFRLTGLEDPHS